VKADSTKQFKCNSYSMTEVDPSATVRLLHLSSPRRPTTIRAVNLPEVELSLAFFFDHLVIVHEVLHYRCSGSTEDDIV